MPAFEGNDLGQLLPYVVGAVFAFGVILVSLAMTRRKAADAPPATDSFSEAPRARTSAGPNLLWKLVFPGFAVLLLGGGVLFFVLPALRDVVDVQANVRDSIKARHEATMKSVQNSSFVYYPRGTAETFQPTHLSPRHQPLVPGFPPPPPPHKPPISIDSRGVVHIR
jgi:hypothetical protein